MYPPLIGCRLTKLANDQAYAATTSGVVMFATGDLVEFDTHGFYSEAKNDRLTVPGGMAGVYAVYWGAEILYNNTNATQRRIFVAWHDAAGNEFSMAGQSTENPVTNNLNFSAAGKFGPVYMSDGNFVVLRAYHNIGVSKDLVGAPPYRTYFNLVKISA